MITTVGFLALVSLHPAPQQLRYELRQHGSGVAVVRDLDGDGGGDLLVGDWMRTLGISGRRGGFLFELPSVSVFEHHFTGQIEGLGDQDGDGVGDFLAGFLTYSGGMLLPPAVSNPDALLAALVPPPIRAGWLAGAVALDDVDGDGFREIATGWPDAYFARCGGDVLTTVVGDTGGFVQVHAGVDGRVLHATQGAVRGEAFGGVLARSDDLDGDGLADVVAGARYYDGNYNLACPNFGGGYVRAISSSTGATLWQIGAAPRALASVGDVDGDGVHDLALGLSFYGEIELRSGRTGVFLSRFHTAGLGSTVRAVKLAAMPDLDGDGLEDLMVGAPHPAFSWGDTGPGLVLIVSVASGRLLHLLQGERWGQQFGANVAFLGDTNGDGELEIAVGSAAEPGGLVQVFSLPAVKHHGRLRLR